MSINGYLDQVTISAVTGAGGSQDPNTGAWTPGSTAASVLYQGSADVQDVGTVLARDPTGEPTDVSDATVFLADDSVLPGLKSSYKVDITYRNGKTQSGQIKQVRQLDGAVLIEWLG